MNNHEVLLIVLLLLLLLLLLLRVCLCACVVVLQRLAHEDDKEEMRMTASQLLNLLADCLGHDLCKQFVIPEVVSLSEDPVFRVRKSTALNFHNICKVGGEHELLERLMPAFVRLSKDDMYRVRRACAESLAEIAKNVSEDVRLGVLVEIFLRLTHDPSKLVKQSVLQQSGVFIAALPSRAVSETILSQYCSMVFSPTGDMGVDNELRHICAYSFPAVLQVIGAERWPEVREVRVFLCLSWFTHSLIRRAAVRFCMYLLDCALRAFIINCYYNALVDWNCCRCIIISRRAAAQISSRRLRIRCMRSPAYWATERWLRRSWCRCSRT